jgi:catecholate siderophore receptor
VFGAGLGVVYRDSIYSSTTNAVVLPAFTRVDGALFYALSKQYRLQLNVENLFDRKYYASANSDFNITPGSPRAVRVSLNAKF